MNLFQHRKLYEAQLLPLGGPYYAELCPLNHAIFFQKILFIYAFKNLYVQVVLVGLHNVLGYS